MNDDEFDDLAFSFRPQQATSGELANGKAGMVRSKTETPSSTSAISLELQTDSESEPGTGRTPSIPHSVAGLVHLVGANPT